MSGDLDLRVALPRGVARFVVCPAQLAPWTAAFWARTPTATAGAIAGGRVYRLLDAGQRLALESPAGRLELAPQEAESTWDALLRSALLHLTGAPLLHAALLTAPNGRAVLVTGASGTGKSTLAAQLFQRGWALDADDWVQVGPRGVRGVGRPLDFVPPGAPLVWSYAAAADVCFAHPDRLPPPWRTWRMLAAVIWLHPQRGATPRLEPGLPPVTRDLWMLPPHARHALWVLRLFARRSLRLVPGSIEATADAVAALVGS